MRFQTDTDALRALDAKIGIASSPLVHRQVWPPLDEEISQLPRAEAGEDRQPNGARRTFKRRLRKGGGPMQVIRKNRRPSNASAAIAALAGQLSTTPRELSDWVDRAHGVPPAVLMAWICRQFKPSSQKRARNDRRRTTLRQSQRSPKVMANESKLVSSAEKGLVASFPKGPR